MAHQASRDELWGTDSRRVYWWHLPVRPDKTASLGRDMIMALIIWVVLFFAVMAVANLLLAPAP